MGCCCWMDHAAASAQRSSMTTIPWHCKVAGTSLIPPRLCRTTTTTTTTTTKCRISLHLRRPLQVTLRIWVSEANLPKVDHAMVSLEKSMKWDEEVFGLEYDLELFNIGEGREGWAGGLWGGESYAVCVWGVCVCVRGWGWGCCCVAQALTRSCGTC
jgi:hypothetical protein